MIYQVPAISQTVCESVVTRLSDFSANWVDRSPGAKQVFFTFGRATYLDVCLEGADAEKDYYSKIQRNNSVLLSNFHELYEQVRVMLQELLQAPVCYSDYLAIPGFHIFLGAGIAGAGQGRAHFDVQYSRLRLRSTPDAVSPLSITLPLQLPSGGSGLEIWNITLESYERAVRHGWESSLEEYACHRVKAYHSYACGVLAVQMGLILHRISSPGPILPDDRRITFQGHGLRFGGEWHLYW